MDTREQLKEKILSVQAALLAAHPTLPSLLQEIHKTLKSYPEQVSLLEEDEIGILVSGLQKQTKTELLGAMTVKKAGKALKSISAMDL